MTTIVASEKNLFLATKIKRSFRYYKLILQQFNINLGMTNNEDEILSV